MRSYKLSSLYCGFGLIKVYPNSQKREPGKTHTRVVGYRYSCCDDYVPIPGPKPFISEFGFHHSLESCDRNVLNGKMMSKKGIMKFL